MFYPRFCRHEGSVFRSRPLDPSLFTAGANLPLAIGKIKQAACQVFSQARKARLTLADIRALGGAELAEASRLQWRLAVISHLGQISSLPAETAVRRTRS
jgi:hypothetical protein